MLTQGKDKPKCCEKWEARLNKDINWSNTFKKMQNIQEIKTKMVPNKTCTQNISYQCRFNARVY